MSIPLQVIYEGKSSSKALTLSINASRLQTVDELCLEVFGEVESNVLLPLDEYGLYHPKSMASLYVSIC
jgi:CII-binding regulator of phage lambda lysogenization HflD